MPSPTRNPALILTHPNPKVENFTAAITDHATQFIQNAPRPWFFLMSWFHVHTPLFTNRTNRGPYLSLR